MFTWPANCVIWEADWETIFAITDLKLYVQIVTLPTQDNTNLFEQLKLSLKKTINRSKYQSRASTQAQNSI